MRQLLRGLDSFLVEDGAGALEARGVERQGSQTVSVEIVEGVAHPLGAASQILGYLRCALRTSSETKSSTPASRAAKPPNRTGFSIIKSRSPFALAIFGTAADMMPMRPWPAHPIPYLHLLAQALMHVVRGS